MFNFGFQSTMEALRFSLIFLIISILSINFSSYGALTSRRSTSSWEENRIEASQSENDDENVGEENEDLYRTNSESVIDFGEESEGLPLGTPDEVSFRLLLFISY